MTFAYLTARYTHAFHLRRPVYRAMTSRTFNSFAGNGFRKLPESFVIKLKRGIILGEEPPFFLVI